MPPRFAVDQLPDDQRQFVIQCVINGETDGAICAAFEKQFGEKLAKSSLNRWRNASGEYLAESYRQIRYQSAELLKQLDQTKTDKFDFLMSTVEDRLLAQMVQVSTQDPLKLMAIRQREGERRLRERMLALKEQEFELKNEEAETDPWPIVLKAARFMLMWLRKRKPELADPLEECGPDMMGELAVYLESGLHSGMKAFRGIIQQNPTMTHDKGIKAQKDAGQTGHVAQPEHPEHGDPAPDAG